MSRFILIVEDDERQMALYKRLWEESGATAIGILEADDPAKAERLYHAHKHDIAGMILDGAVPGQYLTMIPFIQMVRSEAFPGFMVAASTRVNYRQTMMQYGCTHESNKRDAVQLLKGLVCP